MKPNRASSKRAEAAAQRALFEAVSEIKTIEEARDFLHDLCTPAELQAMTDRWSVVEPLVDGKSYRDIATDTGISVTTVGRVSRFLTQGNGGYLRIFERLKVKAVNKAQKAKS